MPPSLFLVPDTCEWGVTLRAVAAPPKNYGTFSSGNLRPAANSPAVLFFHSEPIRSLIKLSKDLVLNLSGGRGKLFRQRYGNMFQLFICILRQG